MTAESEIPIQWPWLVRGFRKYCVRYARKNFHAVRVAKVSADLPCDGTPILIATNHPGWWDPILCFVISLQFEGYRHYGAMDADALEKYKFMKRVGLFPVERDSLASAAAFLRTGTAILGSSKNALWITAQGHFADVRQRPLKLQTGVGRLAARMTTGWVLPIAMEYCFWNESKPEALVQYGEPFAMNAGSALDGKAWTVRIEERLTLTLDALNTAAIRRDASAFTPLVVGKTGVGGVYDLWRRTKATLRGRRFDASHDGNE